MLLLLLLLNCGLCELKLRLDLACQVEEQTEAVFDLVACPFVLYSHVWRHARSTQTGLYAEATDGHRESGRRPAQLWAGLWTLLQV